MYREKLELAGRVAVVSGGARGIGRAVVEALQEMGARCVIVGTGDAEGRATADELSPTCIQVDYIHLDVRSAAAVSEVFAEALSIAQREWRRAWPLPDQAARTGREIASGQTALIPLEDLLDDHAIEGRLADDWVHADFGGESGR